ncbi:MAG: hypothetical protein LUE10_03335, partial [Alistipes sp.]|nr:hypothetical protein [Alistipes sp.]
LLILLLWGLVFTTISCEKGMTGTGFSLGFVWAYYEPEEMILEQGTGRIEVFINGERNSFGGKKNPNERYMELAERNGDTKYKGQILPGSSPALAENPVGVTVTCDRDIDAAHPAGAPLDDVVLIHGWSYREYIQSSYKTYTKEITENYGYDLLSIRNKGQSPFFRYLGELRQDELKVMKNDFYLYPPREWPSGEYNLTVTVRFDGFELSGDIVYKVR